MDYDLFIRTYSGEALDYDGVYGPQCVDEICYYLRDNGRAHCIAWANAKDWANHPAMLTDFDWIANDSNDYNQVPQRGEIIVWGGDLPGSGGNGHIAIWDIVTGAGRFQSLDQNWGGQYVHWITNHTYDYILGWYRLKPTPPPAPAVPPPLPPTPQPTPAPDPAPANPPPKPVVTPPVISAKNQEQDARLTAIETTLKAITDFLNKIFKWRKV